MPPLWLVLYAALDETYSTGRPEKIATHLTPETVWRSDNTDIPFLKIVDAIRQRAARVPRAASSRCLLGTQPTFTQVPPMGRPALTITVSTPRSLARVAAENAAAPPPTMRKGTRSALMLHLP